MDFETAIKSAREKAQKGEPEHMDAFLHLAEENAALYGRDISEIVSEIRTQGYEISLKNYLDSARQYAATGNPVLMDFNLEKALSYLGTDISVIEEIRTEGYFNSVDSLLESAGQYADRGQASLMDMQIEAALKYSSKAGRDITDLIDPIRKFGYEKAIPSQLDLALQVGMNAIPTEMEQYLETASTYANQVKIDISEEVDNIRRTVYGQSILSVLYSAREAAQQKDRVNMNQFISLAEKYADRIGEDISTYVKAITSIIDVK